MPKFRRKNRRLRRASWFDKPIIKTKETENKQQMKLLFLIFIAQTAFTGRNNTRVQLARNEFSFWTVDEIFTIDDIFKI